MAAYEILLLNTAVPQIQAAQSGDTYVVPRDIAFSAALTLSAGTANGVPYLNGSKVVTTSSALTFDGTYANMVLTSGTSANGFLQFSNSADGGSQGYIGDSKALITGGINSALGIRGESAILFGIAATEGMRLTSTGLGVGTNNPASKLSVFSGGIVANFGAYGVGAYDDIEISAYSGECGIGTRSSTPLLFNIARSERARITSGGYFKASDSGTYNNSTGGYHELYQSTVETAVLISAVNASFVNNALQITAARNTTNNSFYALSYYNSGAGAYKLRIADSGDVTNTNGTYGTISDQKHKTDIVDAGSQWADIKALRFRKFKMINDPDQRVQLGVVAQEVELTSPGLVDEHVDRDAEGNDLGTTTKSVKTSILLMKAAVALQEAMTRIEQLEAKVASLESKGA